MVPDPTDSPSPLNLSPHPDAVVQAHAPHIPYAQTVPLNYASGSYQPYESAFPRARAVVRWLWAAAAAHLLMAWPAVVSLNERRAAARGAEVADAMAAFRLSVSISLLASIPLLVATVFWLMWVHRTCRNLPALGAEGLRYSPGWAVAYYFIPILSLFRPLQVMRETWQASDPRHAGGTTWSGIPVWPAVHWWWGLYLTSIATSLVSIGFELQEENLNGLVAAARLDLLVSAMDVTVVILEISIVRRLTLLQESRADTLGTLSPRSW